MGTGGVATVADGGDLVAGEYSLTDLNRPAADVAVARHRAVGVPDQDPGAITGIGGSGFLDDAVGGRVNGRADRAGQVNPVVQRTPAVTVTGSEQAMGRQNEQRALQSGLAVSSFCGVGDGLGKLLGMHYCIGGRLYRDQFDTAQSSRKSGVHRGLLYGQHGTGRGDRLVGVDHRVGGGGCGTRSHRCDEHASLGGTGWLATMLWCAGQNVGVLGVGEHRPLGAALGSITSCCVELVVLIRRAHDLERRGILRWTLKLRQNEILLS